MSFLGKAFGPNSPFGRMGGAAYDLYDQARAGRKKPKKPPPQAKKKIQPKPKPPGTYSAPAGGGTANEARHQIERTKKDPNITSVPGMERRGRR